MQLCLGGLGLPARRLQQETLWFCGAGESSSLAAVLPSAGVKREGREEEVLVGWGREVGLMSHDTLGVVRSSAVAGADHSGQQPGSSVSLFFCACVVVVWFALSLPS